MGSVRLALEMWSESAEDAAQRIKLRFNMLMLNAATKLIILSVWVIFLKQS